MKKKYLIVIILSIVYIKSFAQLTKKPYLIFTDDAKTMKIVFQAKKPQVYLVYYGQTKEYEIGGAKISQQKKGKNENIFSYTIKHIEQNTKYYYKITDKHHKEQYFGSFYSRKEKNNKKVYFSVVGATNDEINNLSEAILNFNKTVKKTGSFVLHTGNFINNGNKEKCWENRLSSNNSFNKLIANIPIIAIKGKNEAKKCLFSKDKQLFRKYLQYKYPSDKGEYYSFMQGHVKFIVLDQFIDFSLNSKQYSWLKNELSTDNKNHKVVLMHNIISKNKSVSTSQLNDLFEKNNVKIVFTGSADGYLHSQIGNVNYFSIGEKNNFKQKNKKFKIIKSLEGNYFIYVKYEANNISVITVNSEQKTVYKYKIKDKQKHD